MRANRILIIMFVLVAGSILAIGRLYDHRLEVFGVNLTIILSSIYCIIWLSIFLLINQLELTTSKFLQYIFFSISIITNLLLWVIFDVNQYGLIKFFNFMIITVPISIIITEKFTKKDVNTLIWLFFGISSLLLLLSLFNISALIQSRDGVMGGGPIVLSRWLCLGSVISFFHPRIKKYRIILFPLFLIIALFTGSRGPVLSLIIVLILYFLINFKRLFLKTFIFLMLLLSLIYYSGIYVELNRFNSVSRVFINFKEGKGLQSTNERLFRYTSSLEVIKNHPFGVGIGNWGMYSNRYSSIKVRTVLKDNKLPYPHNIFLEIFCELGILTGVVFLAYIVFILVRSSLYIINSSKDDFLQVIFYIFVFLLVSVLLSGDLGDARLLFIIMSVLTINNLYHNDDDTYLI
jgi:hypothetical protein